MRQWFLKRLEAFMDGVFFAAILCLVALGIRVFS